jgi:hypothetical protein
VKSVEPSVSSRSEIAPLTPRLLDLPAAAAYLGGLSPATLRSLIADGVIPIVRPPALRRRDEAMRRILIDVRDLDRLIDSWRGPSNA